MKILYHANCNDGSGAALAAWMCLGDETSTGELIDYIPVQYGSEPPEIGEEEVFILDFSYPRDTICEMGTIATRITILDHHKTAKADLSNSFPSVYGQVPLCDIQVFFDMEKSGAVMTWEYFSDEPIPVLLQHIQDRDLWHFQLAETKTIAAGLQLYPDWRTWKHWITGKSPLVNLKNDGEAVISFLGIQSDKIIQTVPRLFNITGDMVPFYNIPGFMISDTLHAALEKYPECRYAVAYFDLPDKRIYSLRSRSGTDVDVSEIAKQNGGGGHKHAAGFTKNVNNG